MTPAPNPATPFNDEERERLQVEALAKKFENKYVSIYVCIYVFVCLLNVKISAFEVLLFGSCHDYSLTDAGFLKAKSISIFSSQ